MFNRNVFADPIQAYLKDYTSARLEVTLDNGEVLRVQNINAIDDCVAFRVYPRHKIDSDLHERNEGFDTIMVPYESITKIRITATEPDREPVEITPEMGFHTVIPKPSDERGNEP